MKGWIEEYPRGAEEFGLAETMMEERELGIEPPKALRRAHAEGPDREPPAGPSGI